jgi:hypothetical protein
MTTFRHPRPGDELDWLAVDVHGHVGVFSTGGQGPVPRAVLDNLGKVEAAVRRVASLPVVGEVVDQPAGLGNFSFWIEPARRGIYGFDWGPVSDGSFAQLTTPANPITIDAVVDPEVRDAALLVRLPIAFEEARNLYVDALGVPLVD